MFRTITSFLIFFCFSNIAYSVGTGYTYDGTKTPQELNIYCFVNSDIHQHDYVYPPQYLPPEGYGMESGLGWFISNAETYNDGVGKVWLDYNGNVLWHKNASTVGGMGSPARTILNPTGTITYLTYSGARKVSWHFGIINNLSDEIRLKLQLENLSIDVTYSILTSDNLGNFSSATSISPLNLKTHTISRNYTPLPNTAKIYVSADKQDGSGSFIIGVIKFDKTKMFPGTYYYQYSVGSPILDVLQDDFELGQDPLIKGDEEPTIYDEADEKIEIPEQETIEKDKKDKQDDDTVIVETPPDPPSGSQDSDTYKDMLDAINDSGHSVSIANDEIIPIETDDFDDLMSQYNFEFTELKTGFTNQIELVQDISGSLRGLRLIPNFQPINELIIPIPKHGNYTIKISDKLQNFRNLFSHFMTLLFVYFVCKLIYDVIWVLN